MRAHQAELAQRVRAAAMVRRLWLSVNSAAPAGTPAGKAAAWYTFTEAVGAGAV